MLVQASKGPHKSAYVVVVGNEKGGSGKSTTAIHIAIALLKSGQRVATIDLDSRQKSLTHYVENRQARIDSLDDMVSRKLRRVTGLRTIPSSHTTAATQPCGLKPWIALRQGTEGMM